MKFPSPSSLLIVKLAKHDTKSNTIPTKPEIKGKSRKTQSTMTEVDAACGKHLMAENIFDL